MSGTAAAGAVLLDDGGYDQPERDQPGAVEQRLGLIRDVAEAEREARRRIDAERHREEQKEGVAGLPPEPQEEQRRHERRHGDRAHQHRGDFVAHSVSKISPYSRTVIATSDSRVRQGDRSTSGSTSLSITSSRLVSVSPAKHSPLHSSSR